MYGMLPARMWPRNCFADMLKRAAASSTVSSGERSTLFISYHPSFRCRSATSEAK